MSNIAVDKPAWDNSLLTISDLAKLLKVSKASVYSLNYRAAGPPYIRIGKTVRYRRQSVDAWLASKEQN